MRKHLNFGPVRTLAAGFALIILAGALLLMLPVSSRAGTGIPFLNALFTSCSATCVTGLVVYDTWTQFTYFGQAVILLLIQTGGLGFMTIAVSLPMALGRRIGLRERSFLMEAVSSFQLGGVVRLVRRILVGTFLFEGIGAVVLTLRFWPYFGVRAVWYGVFHSVSAFCNAGFDLMGSIAPYASLTPFASDAVVNLTVVCLIVVGGIGFVVWNDVAQNGPHPRRWNLHTRAAVTVTAALIVLGTLAFLVTERNGVLSGMSGGERFLSSLFQSVTPRTAGFNTVNTASLSEGGKLLTMLLMVIGASPGGTGGGIKTTTFLVVLAALLSSMRREEDVNLFRHRLSSDAARRACMGAAFYLLLILGGCFVLTLSQPMALTDAMFESISALGTVGLSTGVTRSLSAASKLAVVLLMYSGRVGSLTVFMAVTEHRRAAKLRSPEGKIIIG